MRSPGRRTLGTLWRRHDAAWRAPAQVASRWEGAADMDRRLLRHVTSGRWWETLEQTGITLLVTREYEHLVMALGVGPSGPEISYLPMPHPSGLVVDRERGAVHLASTRNPNQVYELRPAAGLADRLDVRVGTLAGRPLVPVRSYFFAGCLYLHDLALIRGALHGAAAGENAVVRLHDDGRSTRAWWPRCIERDGKPVFGRNHIQLNSIAADADLAGSYFTASADRMLPQRPSQPDFPVDRRGVLFSGATREPVAGGLTRPHSARLFEGRVWVGNSGYGELGRADGGGFEAVTRLPGWTRGLCFAGSVAFVGTSRVIPRFRRFAPGLDVAAARCGVHAVDARSGRVLGSLVWPYGNQIFAIDWAPRRLTDGFPFAAGARRSAVRERNLFYAFQTSLTGGGAA